jgi:hypothetical protein
MDVPVNAHDIVQECIVLHLEWICQQASTSQAVSHGSSTREKLNCIDAVMPRYKPSTKNQSTAANSHKWNSRILQCLQNTEFDMRQMRDTSRHASDKNCSSQALHPMYSNDIP